jgi:hypothetical protein
MRFLFEEKGRINVEVVEVIIPHQLLLLLFAQEILYDLTIYAYNSLVLLDIEIFFDS